MLNVYPWGVSANVVQPLGLDRTKVLFRTYVLDPLIVALLLMGGHASGAFGMLGGRFVPRGTALEAFGAALCLAGAALAIWACYLLGPNWSGTVQLKRDHELIQRGPYRVVRHPIYTGLLFLFLGNALEVGDWRGLLAVAIVFASFWRKLRLEERWLAEHFGEPYREYQGRTRALVPGLLLPSGPILGGSRASEANRAHCAPFLAGLPEQIDHDLVCDPDDLVGGELIVRQQGGGVVREIRHGPLEGRDVPGGGIDQQVDVLRATDEPVQDDREPTDEAVPHAPLVERPAEVQEVFELRRA
jgi:protein-S-isoprenylcysteine O-methyltransferase Ste14